MSEQIEPSKPWQRRVAACLRLASVAVMAYAAFFTRDNHLEFSRLSAVWIAMAYLAATLDPVRMFPWETGRRAGS